MSYQRTKMPPPAWVKEQHQQAGPVPQATNQQIFYMSNHQTGNMNSSYQAVNIVQQAPSANFTFQDGTNRQMSNRQNSFAPQQQQATFLQQPTGGRNNGYLQHYQNFNNSPQTGSLYSSFSNGVQVANQQQFLLNSSNQTPLGMKMANTTYTQQDMFSNWNQPVIGKQTVRTQVGNVVHDRQYYNAQRAVGPNVNTDPAYTAGTSSSVSGTALKRWNIHTQNPRQNAAQDGLYSSNPPSYQDTLLQSYRNNSNLLSNNQILNVSNLNQRTQQYTAQLITVQNAGKQASSYGNSLQKPFATESNQAIQPMTSTVANNSTTSGTLPYYQEQFLPSHLIQAGQLTVNKTPHIGFTADSFSVTTTANRSGNDKSADGDYRNLFGPSHGASRLTQMAEGTSPQKNQAQSFMAYSQQSCEVHDCLQSMTPCDDSLHSSPGRTGAKAVAVVQPLSQESCNSGQFGECTTTADPVCDPDKSRISPDVAKTQQAAYSGESSENANQIRSSTCPISQSAAPTKGTAASSSSPHGRCELLRELLSSDVPERVQSFFLKAYQSVTTVSQQAVHSKAQESKKQDKDESETPVDLSSIPTTPWTKDMLTKLIQEEEEKSQMETKNNAHDNSPFKMLLLMFWDGNARMLLSHVKGYTDIIQEVVQFYSKHITKDSVILSQVKLGFGEVHKNYHVVMHNDVNIAPPYKSAWLNINPQLDDIDKEFGFPWSMKYGHNKSKSNSQPQQDGSIDNIPAESVSQSPNNLSINTRLETVIMGEDKPTSTIVTTSNESSSDSEDSSDSCYSFEIKVLPPEEAKRIFQEVQNEKPHMMDMDSQPEDVVNTSLAGEMHEVPDVEPIDSSLEKPPPEVCCIARLLETVGGLEMPFRSKCQCKNDQMDCADEATATQLSASKEETQVTSHITFSQPELCSIETIDLTGDDLCNVSYISISDSENENKDTGLKSAGSSPSRNSDDNENVLSSEVACQMLDDVEDNVQVEGTSTDGMQSLDSSPKTPQMNFETDEQKQTSESSAGLLFSKGPDSEPVSKGVGSEKENTKVLTKTTKTVELALFGSSPQKESSGRSMTSTSFPKIVFQSAKTAPKILRVTVDSPVTKNDVYPGTYSVKQRIHEEWRKSFPPITMKLKTSKYKHRSLSGVSVKIAEASGSTSPTEPPAPPGKSSWNRKVKRLVKRRWNLSNGAKMRADKTKNAVTRRNKEVEGELPREKFRVSPKPFSLSGC